MVASTIHCPLCDATKITGLGSVIYDNTSLVQYRCHSCGEWFFLADQRTASQQKTNLGSDMG